MTDAGGGFYSAEDADSVIDARAPRPQGRRRVLHLEHRRDPRPGGRSPPRTGSATATASREGANVENDPHGEFTGKNILYQAHTVEETARHFGQPPGEVQAALDQAARVLLAARAKRVRPHLDDKILTAWNGLMISAFAKGGAVLDDARYAEAARRAAEFVIGTSVRRRPAAPCCAAIARATPPFPASSTTTPSSSRACSISTKRNSTCATWNWPSASPKSSRSCSRTPRQAAFFSTAADDPAWSCASRKTTMAPNPRATPSP